MGLDLHYLHDDLEAFCQLMIDKLQRHEQLRLAAGGEFYYTMPDKSRDDILASAGQLLDLLGQEYVPLIAPGNFGDGIPNAREHLINIANYCMMIHFLLSKVKE